MEPAELTALMSFRFFLTMKKYYKNPVSLLNFESGEKTLKPQDVPIINLPIKSRR